MPRSPSPIRPRVKDAKLYENAVRASFLDPMFAAVQARLANVVAVNQVWAVMDDIVRRVEAKPYGGVPINEVTRSIRRMEGWHRDRVIKSFRAALGVDIRPLLAEPAINEFMRAKLTENVDLIKTIPRRMHDGLRASMTKALETQPFDQQLLNRIVREQGKSAGYNLRRITRDQTFKSIGQLTEIRQKQLGISKFTWRSSADERVRPEHQRLDGQTFEWNRPPSEGLPGQPILCRCTAEAVIDSAVKTKLTGDGTTQPGQTVASPQPPPPPAPPPEKQFKFWEDPAYRKARKPAEMAFHERSWKPGAPNYLLRAVARRDPLAEMRNVGKGAYYQPDKNKINMWGKKAKPSNNEYGESIWRHEFGHAMDYGSSNTAVISHREAFRNALKAERVALRKKPGSIDAARAPIDRQAAKIAAKSADDRARDIAEAMKAADLDESDVRAFLDKNSLLGYDGAGKLTAGEADAITWRFAKAWGDDDPMGILYSLSGNYKNPLMNELGLKMLSERGLDLYSHYSKIDNGVAKALSDALDATTHGSKKHLFGHSNSYYSKFPDGRVHEAFANIVSILGSGPFGERLLRKILPNMTEDIVSYLKNVQ